LAAAAVAARRPPSILIDVSDALFVSRKKVIFFKSKYCYYSSRKWTVGFVNLADSQMLSRLFHALPQLIRKMSNYVICKKLNHFNNYLEEHVL